MRQPRRSARVSRLNMRSFLQYAIYSTVVQIAIIGKEKVMSTTPNDAPKPGEKSSACRLDIHIEAQGDVNIHQHCPPDAPGPCEDPSGSDACYPPVAPGNTCLPPVAGRKQKRSPAQKL